MWLTREGMRPSCEHVPIVCPERAGSTSISSCCSSRSVWVSGHRPTVRTRTGPPYGAAGLLTTLKEGWSPGASTSHMRPGIFLVIAEVAAAVVLAVGAGLLARTVYNLVQVDAGFDHTRLVTFAIAIPHPRGPVRRRGRPRSMFARTSWADFAVCLASTPSRPCPACRRSAPPHVRFRIAQLLALFLTDRRRTPTISAVMSDYFGTMGIAIVQGRGFQPADASPALVAVVNETFAKTFWKGQNPIGQRVRSGGDRGTWLTVVGVAKDVGAGRRRPEDRYRDLWAH